MARDVGALVGEKNKLHNPLPWIWLFEVVYTDALALRFTPYQIDVTYAGDIYKAFPVEIAELPQSGQENPTFAVMVSAISREVQDLFDDTDGFAHQKAWVRLVHSSHLSDPTAKLEERFQVRSSSVNSRVATIDLGRSDLFDLQAPKGRFNRNYCRHVYVTDGSSACAYLGDIATCDHTLRGINGCIVHGDDEEANGRRRLHPRQFGGAPGILKERS
jgi:phage-related protein